MNGEVWMAEFDDPEWRAMKNAGVSFIKEEFSEIDIPKDGTK